MPVTALTYRYNNNNAAIFVCFVATNTIHVVSALRKHLTCFFSAFLYDDGDGHGFYHAISKDNNQFL